MNANIVVTFCEGNIQSMTRPFMGDEHDVDFVIGVVTPFGFIKRWGVAVKGEKNPYRAHAVLERVVAEMPAVAFINMLNNELKGYGK